jgi:hypothetical protein
MQKEASLALVPAEATAAEASALAWKILSKCIG